MKKTNHVIKVGSEKFGTQVMKEEECVLFFGASLENNEGNACEAFADMKMVDALLHIKRLHLVLGKQIQYTSSGYFRKGSDLYGSYDRIIEGRLSGAFNPEI